MKSKGNAFLPKETGAGGRFQSEQQVRVGGREVRTEVGLKQAGNFLWGAGFQTEIIQSSSWVLQVVPILLQKKRTKTNAFSQVFPSHQISQVWVDPRKTYRHLL